MSKRKIEKRNNKLCLKKKESERIKNNKTYFFGQLFQSIVLYLVCVVGPVEGGASYFFLWVLNMEELRLIYLFLIIFVNHIHQNRSFVFYAYIFNGTLSSALAECFFFNHRLFI